LDTEITALTRGVGHIEDNINKLEVERARWQEAWVKFGGDPRDIEARIAAIDEDLERLRTQAEGRRAEREKLHGLRAEGFIEGALRAGLLDLWGIEDDGEGVRLRYQAGQVDSQEYADWRRNHQPDDAAPEDWAEWRRTSVRMTKSQLLEVLAIEVHASPTGWRYAAFSTKSFRLRMKGSRKAPGS
jgi:hypothetical protein